jgi:hypothetical protein
VKAVMIECEKEEGRKGGKENKLNCIRNKERKRREKEMKMLEPNGVVEVKE